MKEIRVNGFVNDAAGHLQGVKRQHKKGLPTIAAYAATKAAVRSLARSFSAELLDRKIRVNVLSPGPVDTPVFERSGATQEEVAGAKRTWHRQHR